MKSNKLKALQVKHGDAVLKVTELKSKQKSLSRNITSALEEVGSLSRQINALTLSSLSVSEHALLRLMERKYEFPVKTLEKELLRLLKDQVCMDGEYPLGDGIYAVVKDNVVVTIVKK